jgi:hypothetical protein
MASCVMTLRRSCAAGRSRGDVSDAGPKALANQLVDADEDAMPRQSSDARKLARRLRTRQYCVVLMQLLCRPLAKKSKKIRNLHDAYAAITHYNMDIECANESTTMLFGTICQQEEHDSYGTTNDSARYSTNKSTNC